jgi:alpha-tubulin suppressor-like RCC1 family protein
VSRRCAASVALVCLLAALAFAGSAQAAGGTAVGWGFDNAGQVGNGGTVTTGCECVELPAAVGGLSEVTQISGGYEHTLALRANGTVMAWGSNEMGQLGIGNNTDSPIPVQVNGIANAVQVAAGVESSAALLANGTVMAWGRNDHAELGQGSATGPQECGGTACAVNPMPVPGVANAIAIGANFEGTVALLADGTLLYWGNDRWGEAGTGVRATNECQCVVSPTPVPGVSGGLALSTGWYLSSILHADGTIVDWGYNYEGQVGNGAYTHVSPCNCSAPVQVAGVAGVKETVSGGYQGLALLPSGSVSAWGANYAGQLGNGTFTEDPPCECIPLPGAVSLASAQALSGGAYATLALLPDGSVMSWGEDDRSALGDGAPEQDKALPSPIAISGASAVNLGSYTGFALVGPSQKLKVTLAGAGKGAVGTNGLICPGSNCHNSFPQGQVRILRAEAAAGTKFAGFSGPCKGTAPCHVKLSKDQTVTATFGPAKGTKIGKAKVKKSIATFKFSTPGAITKYQCLLKRPGKHKKPKFSTCKSPKAYKSLKPGKYAFKVRGLDVVGADKHPAVKKFTIAP